MGVGAFLGQPLGCLLRSWQARGCAAEAVSREMRPRRLWPARVFLVSYWPLARPRSPSTITRYSAGNRPRTGRAGAVGRGDGGGSRTARPAAPPAPEPPRVLEPNHGERNDLEGRIGRSLSLCQHLHSAAPLGVSEKSEPTSGVFISDPSRFMRLAVSVCNRAPKLGSCNDCLWGPR